MECESKRPDEAGAHDPGGPLVVVCVGHRCAGLHALAATDCMADPLPRLKAAVRASHGGVLITTGCMGPCHEGAVVGVGHRPPTGPGKPLVVHGVMLLGGMECASRAEALTTWFEQGGPARAPLPTPVLTEASLGAERSSWRR